jgi:hypothetical protein
MFRRAAVNRLAIFLTALVSLATGCCGSSPPPPVCSGACSCEPPTSQGTGGSTPSTVVSVCACASGQSCVLGLADGGAATDTELDCPQSNACEINAAGGSAGSCGSQSVCNGTCGNGCKYSCTNGATCGVDGGPMNLGNAATFTCSGSSCTIAAGNNSAVACESASTCVLAVGASSAITCQGGSTCHITCASGCTVSCGGGSTCDCPGNNCGL